MMESIIWRRSLRVRNRTTRTAAAENLKINDVFFKRNDSLFYNALFNSQLVRGLIKAQQERLLFDTFDMCCEHVSNPEWSNWYHVIFCPRWLILKGRSLTHPSLTLPGRDAMGLWASKFPSKVWNLVSLDGGRNSEFGRVCTLLLLLLLVVVVE